MSKSIQNPNKPGDRSQKVGFRGANLPKINVLWLFPSSEIVQLPAIWLLMIHHALRGYFWSHSTTLTCDIGEFSKSSGSTVGYQFSKLWVKCKNMDQQLVHAKYCTYPSQTFIYVSNNEMQMISTELLLYLSSLRRTRLIRLGTQISTSFEAFHVPAKHTRNCCFLENTNHFLIKINSIRVNLYGLIPEIYQVDWRTNGFTTHKNLWPNRWSHVRWKFSRTFKVKDKLATRNSTVLVKYNSQ